MAKHSSLDATLGSMHTIYWISNGINTMKYYLKACVTHLNFGTLTVCI